MRRQVLAQRLLVERRSRPSHDRRRHHLAEALVGQPEHGCLGHPVVGVDGRLDLRAIDVLAAAQHHVLGPVDDEDEAVVVDAGDVAGVEPAVLDRLRRRLGSVEVALHHDRAAHAQLADDVGAGCQHVALGTDEASVEGGHDRSTRQRLVEVEPGGVGGDDAAGLGEAVAGGRPAAAERLLDLVDEVRLHRRAATGEAAQRRRVTGGEVGMSEQLAAHRRHARRSW